MIRVLHVFYEMANGGVEQFVMNYYRHINREKIQFDFLVSAKKIIPFEEEIKELGGRVFYAYPFKQNPIKNYYDIARIVKENKYRIVHRHTGSAFGYWDLRAAKHGGAKGLILHAHNNQAGKNWVHYVSRLLLNIECEKIACSKEAGKWLYGKNSSFLLMNNAIESDRFRYSDETRRRMRKRFHCEDKYVIGHVGRFEEQKNHKRLLQILKEIVKKKRKSCLICIGIGSLLNEIKKEAIRMGMQDQVLFLGERDDVNDLMSMFDCFLLPSLYEGFPYVLVEAQTNGLQSVVSKQVPIECNITGNIEYVDLSESDEVWADRIISCERKELDRTQYADIMAYQGFDIHVMAERLEKYYVDLDQR